MSWGHTDTSTEGGQRGVEFTAFDRRVCIPDADLSGLEAIHPPVYKLIRAWVRNGAPGNHYSAPQHHLAPPPSGLPASDPPPEEKVAWAPECYTSAYGEGEVTQDNVACIYKAAWVAAHRHYVAMNQRRQARHNGRHEKLVDVMKEGQKKALAVKHNPPKSPASSVPLAPTWQPSRTAKLHRPIVHSSSSHTHAHDSSLQETQAGVTRGAGEHAQAHPSSSAHLHPDAASHSKGSPTRPAAHNLQSAAIASESGSHSRLQQQLQGSINLAHMQQLSSPAGTAPAAPALRPATGQPPASSEASAASSQPGTQLQHPVSNASGSGADQHPMAAGSSGMAHASAPATLQPGNVATGGSSAGPRQEGATWSARQAMASTPTTPSTGMIPSLGLNSARFRIAGMGTYSVSPGRAPGHTVARSLLAAGDLTLGTHGSPSPRMHSGTPQGLLSGSPSMFLDMDGLGYDGSPIHMMMSDYHSDMDLDGF